MRRRAPTTRAARIAWSRIVATRAAKRPAASRIARAAEADVVGARVRSRVLACRRVQEKPRLVAAAAADHFPRAVARAARVVDVVAREALRVPVGDPFRGVPGEVV